MSGITELINLLITLLIFAIFGRIIMDWLIVGGIMKPNNPFRDALMRITEPILAPIRRYARIGTIDLSPMAAIIILTIVQAQLR